MELHTLCKQNFLSPPLLRTVKVFHDWTWVWRGKAHSVHDLTELCTYLTIFGTESRILSSAMTGMISSCKLVSPMTSIFLPLRLWLILANATETVSLSTWVLKWENFCSPFAFGHHVPMPSMPFANHRVIDTNWTKRLIYLSVPSSCFLFYQGSSCTKDLYCFCMMEKAPSIE